MSHCRCHSDMSGNGQARRFDHRYNRGLGRSMLKERVNNSHIALSLNQQWVIVIARSYLYIGGSRRRGFSLDEYRQQHCK